MLPESEDLFSHEDDVDDQDDMERATVGWAEPSFTSSEARPTKPSHGVVKTIKSSVKPSGTGSTKPR